MAKYKKIGRLSVVNGDYEKDGEKKHSYQEVGVLLATPHASQLLIKMHATATSEPRLVSVFLDKGMSLSLTEEEVGDDVAPTSDEVPF